jgi:hypothetical protein
MPKVKGLKELRLLVKQQKVKAGMADAKTIMYKNHLPYLLVSIFVNPNDADIAQIFI